MNVGDDDDDYANVVDGDVVWFSRYRESTRDVITAPRGRREDNCRWPPPFLGDHTDSGGKYGEDITLMMMMMTMVKMVGMMMMKMMIITTRWLFTMLSQHKGLGWELWRIGSTRRKVEVFSLECFFFAFSSPEFFFCCSCLVFFHWIFPPGNCAFCLFAGDCWFTYGVKNVAGWTILVLGEPMSVRTSAGFKHRSNWRLWCWRQSILLWCHCKLLYCKFLLDRKGAMLGFSTMGVTFIMGGYLMLGAVIFSGLEGGIFMLP